MNRGRTEEQVHVRAAVGRVIELPFLELAEEGWNPAMMRLTIPIDPGRIKRGVKPLVDVGPVFEAGKTYSRTSGEAGRDAEDRPRRTGFEKRFRVGPADRSGPDPARGTFTAPTAGARAPPRRRVWRAAGSPARVADDSRDEGGWHGARRRS
jgi:hypothetical protein